MKKTVLELRPTQFVLGMREVEAKIKKMHSLDKNKLKDYIDEHVVPCVVGPNDHYYLIDHHHFVAACFQAKIADIKIDVLDSKTAISQAAFWKFMDMKGWVYLYDQFGNGPHDPAQLPFDIRGLSDDPYRSIAWELREAGVLEKVQQPFAEFKWASFLRTNLPIDLHAESYDSVVKRAIDLVEAHHRKLPADPQK